MANAYSLGDLLEFLEHARDHGLMPAATAQALAVASRNVFGVLSDAERTDLSAQDIDGVIRRFNNKRAKDFNQSSLKEYGRRVQRALDLYLRWRENPATFTVKTRSTSTARKSDRVKKAVDELENASLQDASPIPPRPGTYNSSLPVRPGIVVTVANIPNDLTKVEAERLANFVRMLAVN